MKPQWVLTDVPDEEVDDVESDFQSEGADKVVRERQPDGKWTVTAYLTKSLEVGT